ncbi:MAG TPA: hypothetical protein VG797_08010 [Phycisphaerales bacterium]|nr:hypothetical protein [Phycisphaerales bacterium]
MAATAISGRWYRMAATAGLACGLGFIPTGAHAQVIDSLTEPLGFVRTARLPSIIVSANTAARAENLAGRAAERDTLDSWTLNERAGAEATHVVRQIDRPPTFFAPAAFSDRSVANAAPSNLVSSHAAPAQPKALRASTDAMIMFASYSADSEPKTESRVNYKGKKVFAAPVKYFEGFESAAVGREWTDQRMPREHEPKFSSFAGPFHNASKTVNLYVEPGHSYVIGFDLYFMGQATGTMKIVIDGQPAYEQSFDDIRAENEAINGKKKTFDADMARGLQTVFRASTEIVEVVFEGDCENIDGAWGLDNIQIMEAPVQPLGELGGGAPAFPYSGSGEGGGITPPFENPSNYSRSGGVSDDGGGGQRNAQPQQPIPAPSAIIPMILVCATQASRRNRREP